MFTDTFIANNLLEKDTFLIFSYFHACFEEFPIMLVLKVQMSSDIGFYGTKPQILRSLFIAGRNSSERPAKNFRACPQKITEPEAWNYFKKKGKRKAQGVP